jgi:hypothetical protein
LDFYAFPVLLVMASKARTQGIKAQLRPP